MTVAPSPPRKSRDHPRYFLADRAGYGRGFAAAKRSVTPKNDTSPWAVALVHAGETRLYLRRHLQTEDTRSAAGPSLVSAARADARVAGGHRGPLLPPEIGALVRYKD